MALDGTTINGGNGGLGGDQIEPDAFKLFDARHGIDQSTLPDQDEKRPLFLPEKIRLRARSHWLSDDPPPVTYLLQDALPDGEVCVLGGAGGSSKTQLMLQMAVGIACGRFVCESGRYGYLWEPAAARPVLVLTAEDKNDDLQRRLYHIVKQATLTEYQRNLVLDNLYIQSVRGMDVMVTQRMEDGSYAHTEVAAEIRTLCEAIPGLGLFCLDPLSRFRGGEEINNEAATAMIRFVESVSEATGSAALIPAHVNKLANATAELTQDSIRGASAIVDGARWAAVMRVMTAKEAEVYGIDPADRRRYVQIAVPKSNNVAPMPDRWLERGSNGYLLACDLQPVEDTKAQNEYEDVIAKVIKFIGDHPDESFYVNSIESQYGGKDGLFGVGKVRLRGMLYRAIEEGDIGGGNGSFLRLPNGR